MASHGSDRLEAHGFRLCFTPLAGVLFTCPSRYSLTIGQLGYLALEGGPPGFRRDFSCPAVLAVTVPSHTPVAYGTLTRSGRAFQPRSAEGVVAHSGLGLPSQLTGRQPRPRIGGSLCHANGLGWSRFAHRYYGNPLFSSG